MSNSASFSSVHKYQTKKNSRDKNVSNLIKLNTNKSFFGIKNNNSIERIQINLYNKKNESKTNININEINERKNSSIKTSGNQINIKYFTKKDSTKGNKNSSKKSGVISSQKTSPFYSKKFNNKNRYTKSKDFCNIILDIIIMIKIKKINLKN